MGKTAHNASKNYEKEGLIMKKRKFWVLGLALLGAVAIAGIGFAGCHRPPMFCGGGEFPKHALQRIDDEIKELNLNEAQQAQYEEIRNRVETELIEVGNTRKAFFEKVKTEMDKETPDLNVLSELLKSHADNFPLRAGMFIDDFMAFYEILNADQKTIVVNHLKDKFKKFEAFRALISS